MCYPFQKKNYKEDDYFNTKLYFDLGKYNNQITESFDNLEPIIENQNGKFLQQCLSKDLLDTIDALIPENELKNNILFDETTDTSNINNSSNKNDSFEDSFVNPNTIKELIPLIKKEYSFTPKNFIHPQKKNIKRNYNGRNGDWICFYCKNLNFSFRKNCNRCGIQKEQSFFKSNKNYSKK